MKKGRKLIAIIVGVLMVAALAVTVAACTPSDTNKIYLITMDKMDAHWNSLFDGAYKAWETEQNKTDGVEATFNWEGPAGKVASEQLQIINSAVANGADVIMLAASNAEGSKSTVSAAMSKGVEFIYVDAISNATGFWQIYATDNKAAGKNAGVELKAQLAALSPAINSGKIGIIFPDSSQTVKDRADGFKEGMGTGWTFDEKTADGGTAANAQPIATTMFAECVAVFGTNEGCTVGAGNAYKALSSKTGKIACGFDFSDTIKELVKDSNLSFVVQQSPSNMGKLGMELALQIIGNTVPDTLVKGAKYDTGSQLTKKADIA